MPQQVGRHPLGQTGELGTAGEWPPDVGTAQTRLAGLRHEQRRMSIGARVKIALHPLQRPYREENRPLFIALADNPRLAGGKINAGAVKREYLGDAHGTAKQRLNQRSETQARHDNSAIGVVKPDGLHKPLDLDGRKEADLPVGSFGKADGRRIESRQTALAAGVGEQGFQRRQDGHLPAHA